VVRGEGRDGGGVIPFPSFSSFLILIRTPLDLEILRRRQAGTAGGKLLSFRNACEMDRKMRFDEN